ncbi:hypothetical protein [Capillimicrobium parvum]|uniref:Ig-like domain-containing protein n=1 Tax=Capillimicrobium parvum TaxID=2884022 RepID=A0A9E7C042_9ACTN|nr:hypothetical protein [Capillimicrobium parvum]UGS34993.1 hypothetical protein DSM104329_01377 [Capillimicrobium parvum]
MRIRVAVPAAILAALAIGAPVADLAAGSGAEAQEPVTQPAQNVVLRVGDSMQVEGASVQCLVTSRGGRPTVECRRTGRLKGTYGMFLDSRNAVVARFHSSAAAQTVFRARHHGDWTACVAGSRARAAQEHCR